MEQLDEIDQELALKRAQVQFEVEVMTFIRDEYKLLMENLDALMEEISKDAPTTPSINYPCVRGILKYFACPKALMGVAFGLYEIPTLQKIIRKEDPDYLPGSLIFNTMFCMNWANSFLAELLCMSATELNRKAIDISVTQHAPGLQMLFHQTMGDYHKRFLEKFPDINEAIEQKKTEEEAKKEERKKKSESEQLRLQLGVAKPEKEEEDEMDTTDDANFNLGIRNRKKKIEV